ncbi:hypothetical protein [Achromobacter sp. Bel]|uniref:hypothetical protein n=1 Tax=Achromobacter sp. Bel TaxID=2727415 RepID=UPI0020070B00|nr:hypothetical protein [Achromobacter sp. Bel]
MGIFYQAVNALETEKHAPLLDFAFRISTLFKRRVEDVFENPCQSTQAGRKTDAER